MLSRSVFVQYDKVHSNTEITREFLTWLFKLKSLSKIFEACGTSNYWKQRAIEAGHDARLTKMQTIELNFLVNQQE